MVLHGFDEGGKPYPKSLGKVGERKLNQSKRVSKLKEQGFQTSNNVVRSQKSGMNNKKISNSH